MIRPCCVICVIFLFTSAIFAAKIPFWGEYGIEIKFDIFRSLSELGYIRNLQTCLSENCSYFFIPRCHCQGPEMTDFCFPAVITYYAQSFMTFMLI